MYSHFSLALAQQLVMNKVFAKSRSIQYGLYVLMLAGLLACHSEETPKMEAVRAELMQQINTLREHGCVCGNDPMPPVNPLTWNTALEDAATMHAYDMYTNNYFSHLSQDGTPPLVRIEQAGYDAEYVGEVIARKYYSTKDVVQGWKASESHCRALMDSTYKEMGGGRKEDYWVVDLGKAK